MLYKVTNPVKSSVLLNLSGLVNHQYAGVDPPFWLDADGAAPAVEVVAAPNGLFMLADIAAGQGPFSPPTPRLFTPNALPFPVAGVTSRPETWLRCLNEWFSGDAASVAGLQEWFGYLLSGDTSAHKVLMLVGPRRSGKGTICRIGTGLIGAANVASTTFSRSARISAWRTYSARRSPSYRRPTLRPDGHCERRRTTALHLGRRRAIGEPEE